MQKDDYKTIVIFRVWKTKPKTCIAFFPNVLWRDDYTNKILCNSYEHVSQHGGAYYNGLLSETRLATPEEYADLKEELESIGYDLDVRKRRPTKK